MASIRPRQPRISGSEGGLLAAQRRAANNPSSLRSDTVQPSASSTTPISARTPRSYEEDDSPFGRYEADDHASFTSIGPLHPARPAVNKGHFDAREGRLNNETTRAGRSFPDNHDSVHQNAYTTQRASGSNARYQSTVNNGRPVLGDRAEHARSGREEMLYHREKASSAIDRRHYAPSRDQENYEAIQPSPIPSEQLLNTKRQMQSASSAHRHQSEAEQSAVRVLDTEQFVAEGQGSLSSRRPGHGRLPTTSDISNSRSYPDRGRSLADLADKKPIVKHEEGSRAMPSADGGIRSSNTVKSGPLKSAMKKSKIESVDADGSRDSQGPASTSEALRNAQISPGKRKSLHPPNANPTPSKVPKLNAKMQKTSGNTQSQLDDLFVVHSRDIARDNGKALAITTARPRSTSGHQNHDANAGQSRKTGLHASTFSQANTRPEQDISVKIEESAAAPAVDGADVTPEEVDVDRSVPPSESEDDFPDYAFSTEEWDRLEEDARMEKELLNNSWQLELGVDEMLASPATNPESSTRLVQNRVQDIDAKILIQSNDDDSGRNHDGCKTFNSASPPKKKTREPQTYCAREDILEASRQVEQPEQANLAPSPTKKTKVTRANVASDDIFEAPPKPRSSVIDDPDVSNLVVQSNGTLTINNSHHLAMNLWRLLESMSRCGKRIAKQTGTKGEIACFADLDKVKIIELHALPDWHTSRVVAHFATTTASSRQNTRLLFPRARSVTIIDRGRIELLNFIAQAEGDVVNEYAENLAYLADPKGLCFDYNISTIGNPGIGYFTQQLKTAWPRLRRVSVHQALDELPFVACGLKHQVHYVIRAWPFTSTGRWMPPARNDQVDELDDDTDNLFSHIDISGATGYDAWFKEMRLVLEHAALQAEADKEEFPKYRIIVPGHDDDIIDKFEAGWEAYKADHKRRMERKWDTWRPKQIDFDIDRVEVEYREEREVQCGICDFTLPDVEEK